MPPGSMGWPVVGETLRLYSDHPDSFFFTRQARYGEIFKSHILGCPCVMLASPEAIRFVMVSQSMLFKPTYPPSKERLIGPSALFFHQGSYHSQIKKLVQEALSLDVIKHMVPHIDSIAISALESWSSSASVVSTFHQMKQAREMLSRILHEIIKERKQKMEMERDLLGYLLNFEQGALSETQISDNIIGVLFAAQDTTASILTWILKYLHENLQVLDSVKVIMESMRMASIISFTFREAVADVEYKGFLIPKGWKVLPLFRSLHHNPDFFLEPRTFDPSRFQMESYWNDK
ncbi:Abscisic acid 8'-hydroxylase CYP707A1 [Linum grandiflorum]